MTARILLSDYPRRVDTVIGPTDLHTVTAWYPSCVVRAGGLPLVLPIVAGLDVDDALDAVDGVLLTGGGDVDPARYGEEPRAETGQIDPARDASDLALVARAVERGLPVLAVCRGLQVLNVALGGTLVQHVPAATGVEHSHLDRHDEAVHRVQLDPASRLASVLDRTDLEVNSLHHQAVGRVAPGLRAVGWAPDGTIEAVEGEDALAAIVGVQWHPELLPDEPSAALFAAFVGEAAGVSGRRGPRRPPRRAPSPA